jgi:hypothetical protein
VQGTYYVPPERSIDAYEAELTHINTKVFGHHDRDAWETVTAFLQEGINDMKAGKY